MANQKKSNENTGLEIAVIGMAGRFPGARSIEEFWRNLTGGVESITRFTADELVASGVSQEDVDSGRYVNAKGFMENVEWFDGAFFGYTTRECELMDPQVRLFHEVAYEALETAGYTGPSSDRQIALFAGAPANHFWNTLPIVSRDPHTNYQAWLLNDKDFLATRVSHNLNLTGPSYTIDTACSTGLVAIDMACRSLLSGACDMALAGAVSLSLPPKRGYLYADGMINSPDGHCRPFDSHGRGTLEGDGVGVVVLKRMDEAIHCGDAIWAVVKGTATNNDGARKVGFTAPSIEGQAEVIRAAMYMAEVDPESIGYVEAHGTGTALGDPIEVEGLKLAFNSSKTGFCYIGSVKSNIGHLNAAAGIAGFIKAVMAVKEGLIPPTLHYERPNPEIDFSRSPFMVNNTTVAWATEGLRRAGVSSFGIGGTNAHVILEQYTDVGSAPCPRRWHVLPLSAKTDRALDDVSRQLAGYLRRNPSCNLADVAFTLQVGRRHFSHRRIVLASDSEQAASRLMELASDRQLDPVSNGSDPLVWVFSGDAGGCADIGRNLYSTEPMFRRHVDRYLGWILSRTNVDLKGVLFRNSQSMGDGLDQKLDGLCLFIVELAMAQLLMDLNLTPTYILADGVGEVVAAYVAGMITLDEALILATFRTGLGGRRPSLDAIKFHKRAIPVISLTTAAELTTVEDFTANKFINLATEPWTKMADMSRLPRAVYLVLGAGEFASDQSAVQDTEEHSFLRMFPRQDEDADQKFHDVIGFLWRRGFSVQWSGLYEAESRRRVPLPSYPFEPKYYWKFANEALVEVVPQSPSTSGHPSSAPLRNELENWFYLPTWEVKPVPRLDPMNLSEPPARWIALVDESGVSDWVVDGLRKSGCEVITASVADDVAEIMRDFQPQRILHGLLLDCWEGPGRIKQVLMRTVELVRTLPPNVAITILSTGLHGLNGEPLEADKATMLGLMNVIRQEYPTVAVRSVDWDREQLSRRESGTLDRLISELLWTTSGDPIVAYRDRQRFVQNFSLEPLEEPSTVVFQSGKTYALIGGLGDIGMALATFMIQSAGPGIKLAFLGRSAPNSGQIQHLDRLVKMGAEVAFRAVDVLDKGKLSVTLDEIESSLGPLVGVVYLVGAADGRNIPLTNLRDQDFQAQLEAKVYGVKGLEHALRGRNLEFVVLMSSLSSLLGGLGYGAYASANAFQDQFARQISRRSPTRWVSVGWDGWSIPNSQKRSEFFDVNRVIQISPQEGGEALARILAHDGFSNIYVSTQDLQLRLEHWWYSLNFGLDSPMNMQSLAVPGESLQYPDDLDSIKDIVANVLEEFLETPAVGTDDNIFELGLSSIDTVHVAYLLTQALGREVPVTTIFTNPTVGRLAKDLTAKERDSGELFVERVVGRSRKRRSMATEEDLW